MAYSLTASGIFGYRWRVLLASSCLCVWGGFSAGCGSAGNASVSKTQAVHLSGDATLELNARPRAEGVGGGAARFYVAEINGPGGRQELALGPVGGFYRLRAGINTLTIKTLVYDYHAPDANPDASTATLVLVAAPGVAYTLHGFDDGQTLTIFIAERNTLKVVSPEVQVPVSKPPPTAEPRHIPIPIVIPIP